MESVPRNADGARVRACRRAPAVVRDDPVADVEWRRVDVASRGATTGIDATVAPPRGPAGGASAGSGPCFLRPGGARA
jgi:hypothetical protein